MNLNTTIALRALVVGKRRPIKPPIHPPTPLKEGRGAVCNGTKMPFFFIEMTRVPRK
jgi:hypothetical protein